MTDEQIIKAFEICYINKEDGCESCPLIDEEGFCTDVGESTLLYDVLDLINRQQAEIERLTTMNSELNIGIKKLKEFAIKEFAERLHEKVYNIPTIYNAHFGRLIDITKAEMTEPVKLEHNSLCETETYMGER